MKKHLLSPLLLIAFIVSSMAVSAQCLVGEVEVSLVIETDNYGNELYWQLVPQGNACGVGQIASGGNSAVGCNGRGDELSPPGGYGDNTTVNAGPWCLTTGNTYALLMIDDWDDGANHFGIISNGYQMHDYTTHGGTGGNE